MKKKKIQFSWLIIVYGCWSIFMSHDKIWTQNAHHLFIKVYFYTFWCFWFTFRFSLAMAYLNLSFFPMTSRFQNHPQSFSLSLSLTTHFFFRINIVVLQSDLLHPEKPLFSHLFAYYFVYWINIKINWTSFVQKQSK